MRYNVLLGDGYWLKYNLVTGSGTGSARIWWADLRLLWRHLLVAQGCPNYLIVHFVPGHSLCYYGWGQWTFPGLVWFGLYTWTLDMNAGSLGTSLFRTDTVMQGHTQ